MATSITVIGGTATELHVQVKNGPSVPLWIKDFSFLQNKRPVHPHQLANLTEGILMFNFEKSNYPTYMQLIKPGYECDELINPNEP